jgi:DNA-binding MarR family transcriptional regulator
MHDIISKNLKRYNYLLGETGAAYHEMSLKLGMSDSAISILYAVLEQGESRPLQQICHCTGLSKQTINSAIRKLEAEGIIYLEMAGSKNKTVCLTEKGKLLAEKTAGKVLKAEDEIFASWPQKDVDKYLQLTEAYLLALKEKVKTL